MSAFEPEHIAKARTLLCRRDRILGSVIRQVGDFTLKTERGGYEILVRSILSQQISTAAAATIRSRLKALLPAGKIRPDLISALSDEQLQQAGISVQKRGYIRDLTEHTMNGTLNFRRISAADDEAAIQELIQVRGIGRWTAQMFLLFSLGRPDVFAPDDLGLKNAMIHLYQLSPKPTRDELEDIARKWSPWRSVASWYLWRAGDQKLLNSNH